MNLVQAVYQRQLYNAFSGCWLGETPIEVEAECFADSGDGFASETLVIWTDETLKKLARLSFSADELAGATEAMEAAFDCYRSRLAQQTGDQAFFDARNSNQEAATAAE